jgi:hypothetical protein
MSVSKIFQNQIGTVKLSDLDDNFSELDVRASSLESRIESMEAQVVNLNDWTVVEDGGMLYFKFDGVTKMSLSSSGDLVVVGTITSNGTP